MQFYVYPRKIFQTVDRYADPPILRNYIKMYVDASVKRTCRLLTSFDELKHELRCSVSNAEYASPSGLPHPIAPVEGYDSLLSSLDRAQQVQVCENKVTEEFIHSRDEVAEWSQYRRWHHTRRLWSEEFRSNLDWDWDLSSSLKHLFKEDKDPLQATSRLTPNAVGLSVSAVSNGPHITVFIESTNVNKLEKVDVRITTTSEDSEKDKSKFSTCLPLSIENNTVTVLRGKGDFQGADKGSITIRTGTLPEGATIVAGNSLNSRDELCRESMGEIDSLSLSHHDTKAWLKQEGEFGGSGSDVISICSLD